MAKNRNELRRIATSLDRVEAALSMWVSSQLGNPRSESSQHHSHRIHSGQAVPEIHAGSRAHAIPSGGTIPELPPDIVCTF